MLQASIRDFSLGKQTSTCDHTAGNEVLHPCLHRVGSTRHRVAHKQRLQLRILATKGKKVETRSLLITSQGSAKCPCVGFAGLDGTTTAPGCGENPESCILFVRKMECPRYLRLLRNRSWSFSGISRGEVECNDLGGLPSQLRRLLPLAFSWLPA